MQRAEAVAVLVEMKRRIEEWEAAGSPYGGGPVISASWAKAVMALILGDGI